jgi:glyoxylase-like metal-dependent hydrolase (beta-lactamase superfamily II)
VNLYAVDLPGGRWTLVDTGIPSFGWYVRKAVESRYGAGSRPEAIIPTHGHFDHAGNARELAELWDVPVYAHTLEMPYLTGRSDYAPQDPTPGGAMCFLSRFFPRSGIDLGRRRRAIRP